jgi:hypothetical protein
MLPWLPNLILFSNFEGIWEDYLEALYAAFCKDFLGPKIAFRGKRICLKRHPIEQGKEATFWHLISAGKTEEERVPDMRRCERICWPRAIIDNCEDGCLKIWSEERNGSQRIHIFCESAEYLLVLADRGSVVLPWTAYPVERPHERAKLIKRWKGATGA